MAANTPPRLFKNDKWQEIYTHFIASISNKLTRRQYAKTLCRFFAFAEKKYGHQCTPDKIVQADIEDFLNLPVQEGKGHRAGQPLAPYSRNTYAMHLRVFYKYCGQAQQEFRGKMVPILKGPAPTEHVKSAKTGDVDRDMEEHEVRAFFAAIDTSTILGKRDYALFWTLFVTGRRRMEVASLLRGDLEPVMFAENGRTRQGWLYHYRAKWRVVKDSAEMPAECMVAIRDFHAAAGRNFDTMAPEEPLFPGIVGPAHQDKPMALSNVGKRFRLYADAAGIGENIVTHSLRHESAWQRYLANGHDLLAVKDDLGHSSITTTMLYIERRKKKRRGDPTAGSLAAKFART